MILFSKKNTVTGILCFFLAIAPFFAQESMPEGQPPVPVDESTVFIDTAAEALETGINKDSSASGFWILLRVVLVLALVCAGIYTVVYILKKSTKINAGNDPYLKNVALLPLSPNKSVRIITAGSQAFVIGVTEQAITLISEITDRELIDAMNLESDKSSSVPIGSFASVISSFLPKKVRETLVPEHKTDVPVSSGEESTSALATTDFLKKQRERLTKGSPE